MASSIPYLNSPGSLKTALDRIKGAATPPRVNGDFVEGTLMMKGGAGKAITPYLKKIGLVATDGTPTELYKQFRGGEQNSKSAAAEAMIIGYRELSLVNENFYNLNENELLPIIYSITGFAATSDVPKRIYSTMSILKSYASFDKISQNTKRDMPERAMIEHFDVGKAAPNFSESAQVDFKLAYTINLNLPATTDQSVFNAIFKSLKEHLLNQNE